MKLHFKPNLDCHLQAIEAVCDFFRGQEICRKELAPAGESTVVFRDSAFADDVAKTNLAAILQQHGLENVRSS
jgi:adenine-specific DNA-methyltransferase